MKIRLLAVIFLALAINLEGCSSEPLPTVDMNAPPPSGPPASAAPSVLPTPKKPGGKKATKPAPAASPDAL